MNLPSTDELRARARDALTATFNKDFDKDTIGLGVPGEHGLSATVDCE